MWLSRIQKQPFLEDPDYIGDRATVSQTANKVCNEPIHDEVSRADTIAKTYASFNTIGTSGVVTNVHGDLHMYGTDNVSGMFVRWFIQAISSG